MRPLYCVSQRLVITEEWQPTEGSFSQQSSPSSSKYVRVEADFLAGLSFYTPPAFLPQIPGSERVSGLALRFHNCSFCSQPSATGRSPRSGCSLLAWSFIPGWTGFLLEQLRKCKTPQRTVDLASATTEGKHPKHIFKMNETWLLDVVAQLGPMNLCKWELLIASRHIDPQLLQGGLLDCFFTTSWVSFFSMNEACRWQMTLPCQLMPLFWTLNTLMGYSPQIGCILLE